MLRPTTLMATAGPEELLSQPRSQLQSQPRSQLQSPQLHSPQLHQRGRPAGEL